MSRSSLLQGSLWSRSGTLALILTIGASGISLPRVAHADDAVELNQARAKFQRALELKQAEDWGGALRLLRDVGQVKMTPQIRYHIATCEERLGQLVVALGGYEIALNQSQDMPAEFISEVETAIAELRERIPKVVIQRGAGAEAAVIELDQVALGTSSIGVEIPLDPGPHTVASSAPGYEKYSRTFTVNERETQTVILELTPVSEKVEERVEPPPPAVAAEEPGYGVLPYILGGVGVLGLVGGGVLLPLSQGKVSQVESICGGSDCSGLTNASDWREATSLADEARLLETIGWVSVGVGAASLATGIVLYLIDPSRKSESVQISEEVALWPSAPGSQAGFSLIANF